MYFGPCVSETHYDIVKMWYSNSANDSKWFGGVVAITHGITHHMKNALKSAVRQYYKGVCQYCGAKNATHIEHIEPLAKGGADELTNVTLACGWCNIRKQTIKLDPMYAAIAHARTRQFAPRILGLTRPTGRPSRLSAEDRRKVRELLKDQTITATDIARAFGVSRATIQRGLRKDRKLGRS